MAKTFFALRAWLAGGWQNNVLLGVDAAGHWSSIEANALPLRDSITLAAPVLPGVVNAHSHAFQRAIAGLTERRSAAQQDNFWGWRERMYSVALRISPEQLQAIATQLYSELLQGGYTHVCEFHYLHNDPAGKPYAKAAELSLALVTAAQTVGIGITLLPTLYMRSGFSAQGVNDRQRRFASTPDSILRLREDLRRQSDYAHLNLGIALHSLRAVPIEAVQEMAACAAQEACPLHIHIAEQTGEVNECLTVHGQTPIAYLAHHLELGARWNLVHATHTTAAERLNVAHSGAAIVICPTTEANLGDGVFDFSGYASHEGRWSIGSDSHVSRSVFEELRLLEYSQRLTHRARTIADASSLFDGALAGGVNATGLALGGIAIGNRADFCLVDDNASALQGLPADYVLDALVFSGPVNAMLSPHVAGEARNRQDPAHVSQAFTRAMRDLHAS